MTIANNNENNNRPNNKNNKTMSTDGA